MSTLTLLKHAVKKRAEWQRAEKRRRRGAEELYRGTTGPCPLCGPSAPRLPLSPSPLLPLSRHSSVPAQHSALDCQLPTSIYMAAPHIGTANICSISKSNAEARRC